MALLDPNLCTIRVNLDLLKLMINLVLIKLSDQNPDERIKKMNTIRYYLPGIVLILIAILIIAVPEILIAFIASIIILAGIGALYLGHKIRKSEIEFRNEGAWFSDEDFSGRKFLRRPIFRNWPRW